MTTTMSWMDIKPPVPINRRWTLLGIRQEVFYNKKIESFEAGLGRFELPTPGSGGQCSVR